MNTWLSLSIIFMGLCIKVDRWLITTTTTTTISNPVEAMIDYMEHFLYVFLYFVYTYSIQCLLSFLDDLVLCWFLLNVLFSAYVFAVNVCYLLLNVLILLFLDAVKCDKRAVFTVFSCCFCYETCSFTVLRCCLCL